MNANIARTVAVVAIAFLVSTAVPFTAATPAVVDSHTTTSDFTSGSLDGLSASDNTVKAGVLDDANDGDTTVENNAWSDWSSGVAADTTKIGGDPDLHVAGDASASSSASSLRKPNVSSWKMQVSKVPDGSDTAGLRFRDTVGTLSLVVIRFDHNGDLLLAGSSGITTLVSGYSTGTVYDVRIDWDWNSRTFDVYVDGALEASGIAMDSNLDGWGEVELDVNAVDTPNIDVYYDDISMYNSDAKNQYTSTGLTADNPYKGYTDIGTLADSDVTVTWQGYDGSSWTTIDTTTYTTAGNKTADLSTTNYQEYRVKTAFSATGASPNANLKSDGLTYDGIAPAVDNSSASPSGGSKLGDSNATLSIGVSDVDFAKSHGDSVDVQFEVKKPGESSFSAHDTKTITSNGTVKSDLFAGAGGDWDWRVVATDDYGNTTTSQSFSFAAPSTLYLYNESAPNQVVTTNTPVELTFFGADQTITQTTTDGKVNLTSQNVTVPFVVQVEGTTDYHGRTVYIRDIYAQQRVYLLNKSVGTVNSTFELNDPTGEFGPDTVVYIKKPINVSGDTTYQTIVADRFGVEGVNAVLEQDQRYRISVRSPEGDVQEIGPYRAATSEIVTVEPGAPSVKLSNRSTSWDTGATVNNQTLEVRYVDAEDLTDSVTVYIHERGNESNQLAPNKTYQDPSDLSVAYSLTANESETEWVVNYDIDRDGNTISAFEIASRNENTTPGGLAPGWVQILGVGAVILTAGLFSEADARLGALTTPAIAALLWYAGWLDGVASLAAITMGLFVGVLVYVRGSARGY